MTDLINRADLLAHLNQCLAEGDASTPIVNAVLTAVKCAVEQIPRVDAEPVKRGHWEDVHIYPMTIELETHEEIALQSVEAMCSNCYSYSGHIKERFEWSIKHCPVCGARMDEEVEDYSKQLLYKNKEIKK